MVENLIRKAYDSLKNADAEGALGALREALNLDYEHPEVLYAMKCLSWWMERLKGLDDCGSPYEQGSFIMAQWKPFARFQVRLGAPPASFESGRFALRNFVFSQALACFEEAQAPGSEDRDPEILLQVGRCYKALGDFEKAAEYLGEAAALRQEDAGALAELADVSALLGNNKAAKAFFREAFFLDPQGVDLESMESALIRDLRDKVAEKGYQGPDLAEWIPVYGCIWEVFTVKRDLKAVELGKLKQAIFALEEEVRGGTNAALLKPRLLNRYFWLIDHLQAHPSQGGGRDNADAVEETMLKIKFIDAAVYAQYRN